MPKKSKVNKLARMSDEERARYLQHRADVEEEARRRKRELIARFIKNKLDKEEKYSKTNTAKINEAWRFILRKIKSKQMSVEIQGMMESFNFLMERKSRLIESLTAAIADSDEQSRRAFQAHTETLSYFLRIGTQSLDKLQNEYENQKNYFLENWEKDERNISNNQDQAEFKLVLIKFIQQRDFENYNKEKENESATVKNDARLEHEEDMRHLYRPKQQQIDFYWTQLREVYNGYLEQHKPIMAHYNCLRDKDDFYQRDIAKNEVLIEQATIDLISLQKEYFKTTNLMNNKLERLNNHKEKLTKQYCHMKRDSKVNRALEDEMLSILVEASQGTIQNLSKLKDKLNKIIQMDRICSKYEKDEDKNIASEQTNNNDFAIDFENLNSAMIDECKEYNKLNKFLLKVNRVKVQVMCLKSEKTKLSKENNQLKQYIKRYLTDLALKDTKARPVTSNYHNEMEKINIKISRPVTCIEGALSNVVLHERRVKLEQQRMKQVGGIKSYPRVNCW
ncbi:dynein regulatory complex subunit 2 [Leptidea sinapis]|uniref:dynein regulatory complex subunit 2 n=1 Tax=Leptidea sinapis TaxID=189913 RepID=UPI0021C38864|nr:dynein regulatory complex subunit 2 [Leptidea sinapis]